jgi:hypothetical protein
MGRNLEQVLHDARQAGEGARVGVTVVTNQDNGIASYATGILLYRPGSLVGPFFRPERLSTTGGEPLQHFFSDRTEVEQLPGGGPFGGPSKMQPFSNDATDKLGLSMSRGSLGLGVGNPVAKFTLHSWGNATFNVPLEPKGNLMVGIGPAIGNGSDHAVYVISFHDAPRIPA